MMKRFLTALILLFIFTSVYSQEHYRIVFLNPNPDSEELDSVSAAELQSAHLENMDSLWRIGELLAAGPFDEGGGILIFPDFSSEHVEHLLFSDSAIASGHIKSEVFRMTVPFGAICPVRKGYEMLDYSFIRIESDIQFQIEPDPTITADQHIYAEGRPESIDLKFLGWFDDTPGYGIMVFGNQMDKELQEWLDASPAFANEQISYTFSKIWMANGIYCDF